MNSFGTELKNVEDAHLDAKAQVFPGMEWSL